MEWLSQRHRKCRIIAEMLTERVVLESALQHDRVLSGAKNLLLKYTFSCLATGLEDVLSRLRQEYLDGNPSEARGSCFGGHRQQD